MSPDRMPRCRGFAGFLLGHRFYDDSPDGLFTVMRHFKPWCMRCGVQRGDLPPVPVPEPSEGEK